MLVKAVKVNCLGYAQIVKENYGQGTKENQENNGNKETEIIKCNQIEILELKSLTAVLWAELYPSKIAMLKP